jgi:hypothetical protein
VDLAQYRVLATPWLPEVVTTVGNKYVEGAMKIKE